MISFRSLKSFVLINTILLQIGQAYYYVYTSDHSSLPIYLLLNFLYLFYKNYLLLNLLESNVQKYNLISNANAPTEKYAHEFDIYMAITTCVEVLGTLLISTTNSNKDSIIMDLMYFIPKTFIFELIFDFFHYWAHRLGHHPSIYWIHKKHHTHLHPRGVTVFLQDPWDLLMTNLIPMIITSRIIPLSQHQFCWFVAYKTFIEISGHLGRHMYPVSSFPQFIWLPRLLGIELYSEDHDLHHTAFRYNFSKRFSIWDRVFGTFKRKELKRSQVENMDENSKNNEINWRINPWVLIPSLSLGAIYLGQYLF